MASKRREKDKRERNSPIYEWSPTKEQAALELAADELTHVQIAEKVGTSSSALSEWKTQPEFVARVQANQEELWAAIRKHGIAVRENRVRALNQRWKRMQAVIEARAANPNLANVPGGDTGLLVHNVKGVGKGDDFQLIDLYEVDTGLLRELREHEKQAAQELGQWTDKQEISGPNGASLMAGLFDVALKQAYGDRNSQSEGA